MCEKKCSKCGTVKPFSEFYKNKKRPDGLTVNCSECMRSAKREWEAKNRGHVSNYAKTWVAKNRDVVNARRREYRKRVAVYEKHAEAQKAYYVRNKERAKSKAKAWRDSNPDLASRRKKASYWSDPERFRRASCEYARSNPHVSRFHGAMRRAAKIRATPAWADPDAIRTLYAKAREFSELTGEEWHVDHIVPLRSKLVSGLHCEANLQLLAASVNVSKGNRYWPDMP